VGDALDGAFLGWSYLRAEGADDRRRIALSAAAVAPVVGLDAFAALRDARSAP
jgi:hypothetical protein